MGYLSLLKIMILVVGSQWTFINCQLITCFGDYFPVGTDPIECFRVVPDKTTWLKARAFCRDENADLAQPLNLEALATAIDGMKLTEDGINFETKLWLGGSDAHESTMWHWNDGRPIPLPKPTSPFGTTRNGWSPGQPSSRKIDEDCLYMKTQFHDKSLGDDICNATNPFVCEQKLITFKQPINPKFFSVSRRGRPAIVGHPAGRRPQASRGMSARRGLRF